MIAMTRLRGTGIWAGELRFGDPGEIVEAAAELDDLGYTALWIPDVGGDVFGAVERLLSSTKNTTVATGILNLWMHTPEETARAHARLVGEYGDRFLLGDRGQSRAIDRRQRTGSLSKAPVGDGHVPRRARPSRSAPRPVRSGSSLLSDRRWSIWPATGRPGSTRTT